MMEKNTQKYYKYRKEMIFMVDKKAVIIATVIAIVIIGGILGFKIYKYNKEEYGKSDVEASQSTNIINEETQKQNTQKADKEENLSRPENTSKTDSEENTSSSEKTENNTNTENQADTNTTSKNEKNTDNNENSSEEDAIKLAKQKWGNQNSNVYFYAEDEVEKGVFIISVRDNNTTAELVSYKVNTNTKKVTQN